MSQQMQDIQNDNRQGEQASDIRFEKYIHEPGMKHYRVYIEQIDRSGFYGISEVTESRTSRGIIIPVNFYRQFRDLINKNIRTILDFKPMSQEYFFGLAHTPTLDTEDGRSYYLNLYVEGGTYYVIINQIENGSHVFVTIDWFSLDTYHLVVQNYIHFLKNEHGSRINCQNLESSDYSSSDYSSSDYSSNDLQSGDSTLCSGEDDSEWNGIWPSDESESTSIDSD